MPDTFRKNNEPITNEQYLSINAIKDKAAELEALFNKCEQSWLKDVALTNLEQAVMWAVKAVTR